MAKKPTIKQLEERLNIVTSQLNFAMRMLDSIGVAFSSFVRFMEKEDDFKKYLEKNKNLHKLTEEEKNARNEGRMEKTDDVSVKKVRKEKDATTQSKMEIL